MELKPEDQIKICRILRMKPDDSYKASFEADDNGHIICAHSPDHSPMVSLRLTQDGGIQKTRRYRIGNENFRDDTFVDSNDNVFYPALDENFEEVRDPERDKNKAVVIANTVRSQADRILWILHDSKIEPNVQNGSNPPPFPQPQNQPWKNKNVYGYRVCTLLPVPSEGVCRFLGIQGPATIENWLDHNGKPDERIRTVVVNAADETITITRKRNNGDVFLVSRSPKGKMPGGILINKDGGITFGDHRSALSLLKPQAPSETETPIRDEIFGAKIDSQRAQEIHSYASAKVETIFKQVNLEAALLVLADTIVKYEPEVGKRYTPPEEARPVKFMYDDIECFFDTARPEVKEILSVLGFAVPRDFDEPGTVRYKKIGDIYQIEIESPIQAHFMAMKWPEKATITQYIDGRVKLEITSPGTDPRTYDMKPRKYTNDETVVPDNFTLRSGASEDEAHAAIGIVVRHVNRFLTPQA